MTFKQFCKYQFGFTGIVTLIYITIFGGVFATLVGKKIINQRNKAKVESDPELKRRFEDDYDDNISVA